MLVLEVEDYPFARTVNTGKKGNRPPDTIIVTTPITTYTGNRLLYFNRYGKKVTTPAWTSTMIDATKPTMHQDSLVKAFIETVKGYAEFQVDGLIVTDDSTVFNSTPIAYRQEVVLTNNSIWWGVAGGVAYRGSFGTNIEAFVFTDQLSNNMKWTKDASIHEAGHTLGLTHAAKGYINTLGVWVTTGSYTYGDGNFCNWMGVPYYSRSGGFEEYAYDTYGNKIYQKQTIRATVKK